MVRFRLRHSLDAAVSREDYEEAARAYELAQAMEYADYALRQAQDYLEVRRDAYLVLADAARAEGDPRWEEYHRESVKLAKRLLADEAAEGNWVNST